MLTQQQINEREQLRTILRGSRTKLAKIIERIQMLDAIERKAITSKLVGYCFALKRKTDKKAGQGGYCRIISLDTNTNMLKGILIQQFGKSWYIKINSAELFEEDLLRSQKIPKRKFDKILKQVQKLLTAK